MTRSAACGCEPAPATSHSTLRRHRRRRRRRRPARRPASRSLSPSMRPVPTDTDHARGLEERGESDECRRRVPVREQRSGAARHCSSRLAALRTATTLFKCSRCDLPKMRGHLKRDWRGDVRWRGCLSRARGAKVVDRVYRRDRRGRHGHIRRDRRSARRVDCSPPSEGGSHDRTPPAGRSKQENARAYSGQKGVCAFCAVPLTGARLVRSRGLWATVGAGRNLFIRALSPG